MANARQTRKKITPISGFTNLLFKDYWRVFMFVFVLVTVK
jgi:hypothetical protein